MHNMRILMLPDETGPDETYQYLPTALLAAKEVAVWRPSLAKIQQLSAHGKITYNVDDFIKLVERRHVVAVGRRGFFSRTAREADYYWNLSCPWIRGKDDELARIAIADESSSDIDRRVIAAPDASGPRWAKSAIEDEERYKIAKYVVDNRLAPPGILRRFTGEEKESDKIQNLLLNSRNMVKTLEESKSHMHLVYGDHVEYVYQLGNHRRTPEIENPTALAAGVADALILLKQLSREFEEMNILQLAEHESRTTIYEGCSGCLQGRILPVLRTEVGQQISEMVARNSGLSVYELKPFTSSVFIAGSLLAALLFYLSGDFRPQAWAAFSACLAISALGLPARLGERLSLHSVDYSETEAWLALTIGGGKNPTRKQLRYAAREIASPDSR
jgi:hypothetical protein